MRIALAGALLLLLTAGPVAHGQTEEETVRLLVPVETQVGRLATQSVRESSLGWKGIEVPVVGTIDETVARLEKDLGTPVLVEVRYQLLGENEELFEHQWNLRNKGQNGGTPGADIDVIPAWRVSEGSGVLVAVVDSGINPNHPDLSGQIVAGWDFVDGDNDPRPGGTSSQDAHGTRVAGVIAAKVNGQGIAGVAPRARILNVRACDHIGCWSFAVAFGIVYAVDNGADIINLSLGLAMPEGQVDPLMNDAIEYARQHDVLVVSAAGNNPPEDLPQGHIIVPAELPHSNNISVAATDRQDRIANFSYYSPNIDIAAPGVEIPTTSLSGYDQVNGTSFSAPHVAGAAALLLSFDNGLSPQDVISRIKSRVDKPSDVASKVQSGRLNAGSALPRFRDILDHTFEDDITWAADARVTRGCNPPDNTRFCPNDRVTRGQMAAFLRRHVDLPPPTRDHFVDDNGSTFEEDINRLAEAGIARGCNPPANDRFCPDDFVTREQMAAFIVRALDLKANTHSGFNDVPSSNTFHGDIGRLATAGITRGCNPPSNTNYCPKDFVTRGQMAAFVHRSDDFK